MTTPSHQPPTGPRVAVVLAGGDPLPAGFAVALPEGALVVAADAGLAHAPLLGVDAHVVVGDLDSVDATALGAAEAAGAVVERHPEDKDLTDLALALAHVRAAGVDRIVVVGGHGGRLDHLLANALLLAAPELAGVSVVAHLGDATVQVVRPDRPVELTGAVGSLISLLPPHGVAEGVWTEGLRFPLHGEDLPPGSTRGVSNELAAERAAVGLERGVLLAVQPGPVLAPADGGAPPPGDPPHPPGG